MDFAWHPILKKTILADELWEMESPRQQPWECKHCGCGLVACACDLDRRDEYKVRPYFKAENLHLCDGKIDELILRGQTRSVLREQGLPLPIYTSLNLVTSSSADEALPHAHTMVQKDRFKRTATTLTSNPNRHGQIATTIRPLCAQYINFPYDRNCGLTVPGVTGSTYFDVFQPIRFLTKDPKRETSTKIFVGEIMFKEPPRFTEDGNTVVITLNDMVRVQIPSDLKASRYRLNINVAAWGKKSRDAFMYDIEVARNEARQSFRDRLPDRSWVFFLGTRRTDDPLLFDVSDRRLVCTFTKPNLWPKPGR